MDKLKKFMEGRVGVDHLSMALLLLSLVIFLIGKLVWWPLTWVALVPLVLCYYRALSKDRIKRHQENILFLKYWYLIQSKVMNKYHQIKMKLKVKSTYKYFKCSSCGQQLRVPRKKGKIEITCPKCRHTFIKKT